MGQGRKVLSLTKAKRSGISPGLSFYCPRAAGHVLRQFHRHRGDSGFTEIEQN
jgi:hypothetical protein